MSEHARKNIRRVFRIWLALELAAGILALALLVALLPVVVALMVVVRTGVTADAGWMLVLTASISIPAAVFLAREAVRLVVEVVRG